MKNRWLWILAGGLALFGAGVLLLNFRVGASDRQVIPRILVSKLDGYPERLGPNGTLSLALVGEGPLVSALQDALESKWESDRMGRIEWVQEVRSRYPNPVLVVDVGRPGLVWTPFFATSQFYIQVGYANDGDPSFMENLDKTKPYIRRQDPSVVNLYLEFEGTDRSWGLISRPGYLHYLADYFAREIVDAMKGLHNIQDPGGG